MVDAIIVLFIIQLAYFCHPSYSSVNQITVQIYKYFLKDYQFDRFYNIFFQKHHYILILSKLN